MIEWKQIEGWPYEVSSDGQIRSKERRTKNGRGTRRVRERLLKPNQAPNRYVSVVLSNAGQLKTQLVHRLVAQAFIPNPHNMPCVNHKNGDRHDNRIENLEWCTYSENNQHAFTKLRRAPVRVFREMRPNTPVTPQKIELARTLRAEGATLKTIAKATDLSTSTIHRLTL